MPAWPSARLDTVALAPAAHAGGDAAAAAPPLVVKGIKSIFAAQPGATILGTFADGSPAAVRRAASGPSHSSQVPCLAACLHFYGASRAE